MVCLKRVYYRIFLLIDIAGHNMRLIKPASGDDRPSHVWFHNPWHSATHQYTHVYKCALYVLNVITAIITMPFITEAGLNWACATGAL